MYIEETINQMFDIVKTISHRLEKIEEVVKKDNIDEDIWITVSEVARKSDLSPDAVRKQLYSGIFEEDLDFKKDGSKIFVNQKAVAKIQRKRRSNRLG